MTLLTSVYSAYQQLLSDTLLHWPFLLGALAIATGVFIAEKTSGSKSMSAFFVWLFPKHIYRHHSTRLDLYFVVLNTAVYAVFFASWLVSAETLALWMGQRLEQLLGAPQQVPDGYFWPSVGLTLALFVAIDFAFFLAHWLQHKIPLLWRFHRVHHSAEVLNPLTAFRQHPADQLFEGLVVTVATGVVGGIFYYQFFGLAEVFNLMSFNILSFGFFLAGAHLRHSHIRLAYPRWLSRVFISPFQHQIHHSCLQQHQNRNFGGVFAFWDGLFRSWYLPQKDEHLQLGVADLYAAPHRHVLDLYLSPFRTHQRNKTTARQSVLRKLFTFTRRAKYEPS